jgi:tRNA-specific 2-thiouridylase
MMKERVREIALGAGLPVYEKRESQDICFVTDDSYTRFLESRGISEDRGRFVDREGNFLGNHKGILRYTVGQRKGLGIASKEPLYVVAIDAGKNEIVLGSDGETFSGGATVVSATFVAGSPPGEEFHATARVRYHHPGAPCSVKAAGDRLAVTFGMPQRSVTPGQALVLYDGDEVLGGGWIECADASRS